MTTSLILPEEEQTRRVFDVVAMLAKCVEDTFPECLPPTSLSKDRKRKYDDIYRAPISPPSPQQQQQELRPYGLHNHIAQYPVQKKRKKAWITLPPLLSGPCYTPNPYMPYPILLPELQCFSNPAGPEKRPLGRRGPTFTAPLFEEEEEEEICGSESPVPSSFLHSFPLDSHGMGQGRPY